jgi:hypothetical protein
MECLRRLDIRPGTRIYATPSHHLLLTFYTGLPVQNVAPVRKSFLDHYEGELLILEAGPRYESLTWREIQRDLLAAGHPLTDREAQRLEPLLATRLLREELRGRVADVTPPLEPAPDDFDIVFSYQRLKTVQTLAELLERQGNPMFKGYLLTDHHMWWQVFYYRFVNPERRMGSNLSYIDRIRDAHALVLPSGWVLYRCPARKAG